MKLVVAVIAVLLVGHRPARASVAPLEDDVSVSQETADPPRPQSRAVVVLRQPAHWPAQMQRKLAEAIGAELSELRVDLQQVVAPPSGELQRDVAEARTLSREHGAAAVVWLEPVERSFRLYLYEAHRPQLRQRTIAGTQPASVAVEEVTVVLRSALIALLEEMESGMTEVVLPEETTPEVPPPAPPAGAGDLPEMEGARPAWLRVSLGYTGALYARHAPWQSGGFASLQFRPAAGRAYLGLGLSWFVPLSVEKDVDDAQVWTRISRRQGELVLGVEWFGETLRLGPELGLMVDYIQRQSLGAEQPLVAAGGEGRWQAVPSARLRGSWLLGASSAGVSGFGASGVGLSSSVGADFPLARFEHVAVGEEGSVELLRQLAIRPRVDFGVFVSLW